MKKISAENFVIPIGIGIALLVSLTITLLGAALGAWAIVTGKIGEGTIGLVTTPTIILAAAVGALIGSVIIKKMRLPMCLICGMCYLLSLLAITALFFDGQYQGIGLGLIAVLAGCVPVAFLPGKKAKIGKGRKRAYR